MGSGTVTGVRYRNNLSGIEGELDADGFTMVLGNCFVVVPAADLAEHWTMVQTEIPTPPTPARSGAAGAPGE